MPSKSVCVRLAFEKNARSKLASCRLDSLKSLLEKSPSRKSALIMEAWRKEQDLACTRFKSAQYKFECTKLLKLRFAPRRLHYLRFELLNWQLIILELCRIARSILTSVIVASLKSLLFRSASLKSALTSVELLKLHDRA